VRLQEGFLYGEDRVAPEFVLFPEIDLKISNVINVEDVFALDLSIRVLI
jgi:hypothetical protein